MSTCSCVTEVQGRSNEISDYRKRDKDEESQTGKDSWMTYSKLTIVSKHYQKPSPIMRTWLKSKIGKRDIGGRDQKSLGGMSKKN